MHSLLITILTVVSYLFPFAPSEGFVNETEKLWRDEICLNGYWDFKADGKTEWDAVKIRIPSPWNANSFAEYDGLGPDHRDFPSYPKEWERIDRASLRRFVDIPAFWEGKRVIIHFEAVAGKAQVYVNSKLAAENFDLFLPFDADITDLVTPGSKAEIVVKVEGQNCFEDNSTVGRRVVPAGSMWGTHIKGIWQDVSLIACPQTYIEDVYVKPLVGKCVLEFDVTIRNAGTKAANGILSGDISRWINLAGQEINTAPVPKWTLSETVLTVPAVKYTIAPGASQTLTISVDVPSGALDLWTPEHPNLYAAQLHLNSGKKSVDGKYTRFGWREWTFDGTSHCLNGVPYPLKGDSWHFMGIPQMTRRYAWAWFKAIKDMNGNAVRLHAQVYPRFYLDVADELGICVLAETANWASDGGPKLDSEEFWDISRDHLRRMVIRDRNHPGVFGWSISNENKPVILYVFKRPDLMPLQRKAWEEWRDIVRQNDVTRPWISSDGEDDGDGILPVTVGHYGSSADMLKWKAIGKPWGVGEHSMAYYGTPEEVSVYNGGRAYESAEGRMEGIAMECYNLLKSQREAGASYSTVFNMAWYALKPLALGDGEGIVFGPYKEGVPGVQPERLGAFCTTFNPGYDPALPLYEEWPLFDAMRAANAAGGPAASEWSRLVNKNGYEGDDVAACATDSYDRVVFVGGEDSALKRVLDAQGVVFAQGKARKSDRTLVIVDASLEQPLVFNSSDDIWLAGLNEKTLAYYRGLLGLDLELVPLVRSSFIPRGCSWVKGLGTADFYFCEVQRKDVSRYALAGQSIKEGTVLLDACRADWRRWNKRPEDYKTAALVRSERDCPEQTAVWVRCANVWISTLDDFASTGKGGKTLARILKNAGIPVRNVAAQGRDGVDDTMLDGLLTRPVDN
ncbi:MAG: glycoside hydrolase family 2 [Bacteroidales bacterium]|nr:glycoside hydrolase family 2 [Candidatus Hennigimonas equi]